ncbi:hypothetical protein BKA70DRAFT_1376094 [Coprinopsis sp. MPI-PUGE-AT-0042]|nr:hypothetical protein BKA70DRAFT_1376094 [Coprinopsis sp. MPI-PUGE-AT-0042]
MPNWLRKAFKEQLRCLYNGCGRKFTSESGRTKHSRTVHSSLSGHRQPAHPAAHNAQSPSTNSTHSSVTPEPFQGADFAPSERSPPLQEPSGDHPTVPTPSEGLRQAMHPWLTGQCYTSEGVAIARATNPPPRSQRDSNDWAPFKDDIQFAAADFLYRCEEMSQDNINHLLNLWALSLMRHRATMGPYDNYQHIFDTIDEIEHGDAPWSCLKVTVNEDMDEDSPTWKQQSYEVWYRDPDVVLKNMLDNPDFDGQFDYCPYIETDGEDKRRWSDFMSGNYAWKHSDLIHDEDPATKDATYVPIILGADKTTVSVATGDVEYHPLYLSIGNVHNTVRRAHCNAVVPIAFLAIPKGERKSDPDPDFRRFKRQLYHCSLSAIFSHLRESMVTPVLRRCPDGHYRRVIYDLGAFIADYPEQVMLAGIVQGWCPKCTALSSDLDGRALPHENRHVDHLEDSDFSYEEIWSSYGYDTSVVPFTRDFPRADIYEMLSSDLLHQVIKGTFKDHLVTWIYLPAIQGLLPPEVVKTFSAFLDFCYLVRRNDFTTASLDAVDLALARFHEHRKVFQKDGVRPDGFSLPRQHSLIHYRNNIILFGAPNGLCSSITESRHITAVKQPWRQSNRYEALGQMLVINQRLDKLQAARADFVSGGMMPLNHLRPPGSAVEITTVIPDPANPDGVIEESEGGWTDERVLADVTLAKTRNKTFRTIGELQAHLKTPDLTEMVRNFLHEQLGIEDEAMSCSSTETDYDVVDSINDVATFRAAVVTFFAPSDACGIRGMRREWIRATPSWRKSGERYDCVFVVEDDGKPGFEGMSVVQVKQFFSFDYEGTTYPCAVVEWFKKVGKGPDTETGMWMVQPDCSRGKRDTTIIHLNAILRAAHLLPYFGKSLMPRSFNRNWALDAFQAFYAMNMQYQRDMLFRDSSPIQPPPPAIEADDALPNLDIVPTSEEDEIELEFEDAIKAMSEADEAGTFDSGEISALAFSDGTLIPPPSPRSVLVSEVALYKAKYNIQLKRLKLDFIWINRLERVLRDHGLPFPKYPDDLSYSSDLDSHDELD